MPLIRPFKILISHILVIRILLILTADFCFSAAVDAQGISNKALAQLKEWKITGIEVDSLNKKTPELIRIWDSLYPSKKNIILNLLSEEEWEYILLKQWEFAQKNHQTDLQFELEFPLATIYHIESKFTEGIPLLENLHRQKAKLNITKYPLVLIKLEEEYRSNNNMEKVLQIRSERIENGFIRTFWEIYKECGLYQEAISDFKRYEVKPEETGISLMKYYWNLGDLYFYHNSYQQAEAEYKNGYAVAVKFLAQSLKTKVITEENAQLWPGLFNGLIGACLVKQGYHDEAIPLLLDDIAHCKGRYRISSWLHLSDCYLIKKNLKFCEQILDSLAPYLYGKSMKEATIHYYKNYSNFYKAVGKPDSALHYLSLYTQLNDELSQRVNDKQAAFLLANMDLNKRRSELDIAQKSLRYEKSRIALQQETNALLILALIAFVTITVLLYRSNLNNKKSKKSIQEKNRQLEKNAERITTQITTNKILLEELNHRVKNNLQLVYSLINLHARRTKQDDTKQLLQSISGRIQSMSLIHEKLYNRNPENDVDIGPYIGTLVKFIKNTYGYLNDKVVIDIAIEPLAMAAFKAESLGLIIHELVSNAYKHAFAEKAQGVLSILVTKNVEQYILVVRDDGPGFKIENLNTNSLGIKLVKALCRQLQATHQIKTDDGVTHTFTFKI